MGTLRTTLNHAGLVVNGVILGDPAEPTYKTYDHPLIPNGQIADDGTVLVYDTVDTDDPALAANRETIRAAARAALDANHTYLAGTPTNTQALAQVDKLTRQVNALIRLAVGALDGTE